MKPEWYHAGFHVGGSTGIMLKLIWERNEHNLGIIRR